MRHTIRTLAIVAMVIAGLFHFWLGLGGWFTIIGEGYGLQVAMIAGGPLSFLPAVLLGTRLPLAGALWLVAGAVVSTTACAMLSGASDTVGYFWFLPFPMLLSAAAVWFLKLPRQDSLLSQAEALEMKLRSWLRGLVGLRWLN
jgi:hypothetical protein